jgi:thiamine-monophosphate kinase
MEYDDRRTATLSDLGERAVVAEIARILPKPDPLLDGIGHDAAFFDIDLANDEVLVINTDRSGLNVAFQLGLAGAECVGDFGVSHAVSDIVVAGGAPRAITVALLLPRQLTLGFVCDVMQGAVEAASRFGATIVAGDTKANPKFAMVVTAVGTAPRHQRVTRSGARPGDLLVVTGNLGSMLLGLQAFRQSMPLSDDLRRILSKALVEQRPPFDLGKAITQAGLPKAGTDISDGLPGAIHALCGNSHVGAMIDEASIPLDRSLLGVAQALSLTPLQLSSAGGDWQFLYAVPADQVERLQTIAATIGERISVIGKFIAENLLACRGMDGVWRTLLRVEHDTFADGPGSNHFSNLAGGHAGVGAILPQDECARLWTNGWTLTTPTG